MGTIPEVTQGGGGGLLKKMVKLVKSPPFMNGRTLISPKGSFEVLLLTKEVL